MGFSRDFTVLRIILVQLLACILGTKAGFLSDLNPQNILPNKPENLLQHNPIQSLTQIKPKSLILSNSNNDTESEGPFAKCLLTRASRLSEPPAVRFYSWKKHGANTRGCSEGLALVLQPPEADTDQDADSINAGNSKALSADQYEVLQKKILQNNLYEPKLKTYFIVHGFLASWDSSWMGQLKDLILDNEKANVFIVDWSGGAKPMLPIDYPQAVANTNLVGKTLARFVRLLMQMTDQVDGSQFHFIGHSLGAHVSGYVGYQVENLGRITGLDPAGPCYGSGDLNGTPSEKQLSLAREEGYIEGGQRRLSRASAKLVVALHTDITKFGLREPCAHLDLYLNGGDRQPSCEVYDLIEQAGGLANMNVSTLLDPKLTCAHSFSYNTLAGWNFTEAQHSHQCYPMAHRCKSLDAFQSGECGICTNQTNGECFYAGLSADQLAPDAKNVEAEDPKLDAPSSISEGEISLLPLAEPLVDLANPLVERSLSIFRRGQHFLRSIEGLPSCLFHYQLLVAVSLKEDSDQEQNFFARIPLPPGLNGAYRGRLVRVSHQIEQNSTNYRAVIDKMAELNTRMQPPKRPGRLHIYSALLIFEAVDDCAIAAASNQTTTTWRLCRPLELPAQKIEIFGPSSDILSQLEWVAVNYMSGLDLETRRAHSAMWPRPAKAAFEVNAVDSDDKDKLLEQVDSHPSSRLIDRQHMQLTCMIGATECPPSRSDLSFSIEMGPSE